MCFVPVCAAPQAAHEHAGSLAASHPGPNLALCLLALAVCLCRRAADLAGDWLQPVPAPPPPAALAGRPAAVSLPLCMRRTAAGGAPGSPNHLWPAVRLLYGAQPAACMPETWQPTACTNCLHTGGHEPLWRSMRGIPAPRCCHTASWTEVPAGTPFGMLHRSSWSVQVRTMEGERGGWGARPAWRHRRWAGDAHAACCCP